MFWFGHRPSKNKVEVALGGLGEHPSLNQKMLEFFFGIVMKMKRNELKITSMVKTTTKWWGHKGWQKWRGYQYDAMDDVMSNKNARKTNFLMLFLFPHWILYAFSCPFHCSSISLNILVPSHCSNVIPSVRSMLKCLVKLQYYIYVRNKKRGWFF